MSFFDRFCQQNRDDRHWGAVYSSGISHHFFFRNGNAESCAALQRKGYFFCLPFRRDERFWLCGCPGAARGLQADGIHSQICVIRQPFHRGVLFRQHTFRNGIFRFVFQTEIVIKECLQDKLNTGSVKRNVINVKTKLVPFVAYGCCMIVSRRFKRFNDLPGFADHKRQTIFGHDIFPVPQDYCP